MKIVIVIDAWNKGNGGVVVTHTLVKELQARGHEVSLVTTAGEAASKFKGKVTEIKGMYRPALGNPWRAWVSSLELAWGRTGSTGKPSREQIWCMWSFPFSCPEMP